MKPGHIVEQVAPTIAQTVSVRESNVEHCLRSHLHLAIASKDPMRLLDALRLRRCRLRKFEERLRQGIDKFVELVVQVMERADLREVVQALYCLVQNLNFRLSESTSCSKGVTNCFHAHRAVATARCSPAGGKIQKGQRGKERYCAGLKGQGCRFCQMGGI